MTETCVFSTYPTIPPTVVALTLGADAQSNRLLLQAARHPGLFVQNTKNGDNRNHTTMQIGALGKALPITDLVCSIAGLPSAAPRRL
jgi:hypothetical protein